MRCVHRLGLFADVSKSLEALGFAAMQVFLKKPCGFGAEGVGYPQRMGRARVTTPADGGEHLKGGVDVVYDTQNGIHLGRAG
jgi:hypothetical protein